MKRLTILIPDYRDLRVEHTIRSIACQVDKGMSIEILVVLTDPQQELYDLLDKLRHEFSRVMVVRHVLLPKERLVISKELGMIGSLAMAYNEGIQASSNDDILIVDADTVLLEGCLKSYVKHIGKYDVVKGKVEFREAQNLGEKLTNGARKINTTDSLALYTPSLMFNKKKLDAKGISCTYSEWVPWSCDSEFGDRIFEHNSRIIAEKGLSDTFDNPYGILYSEGKEGIADKHGLVTIRFEPMGAIIHPAYSIKADLRCALRFGIDEYFFQEKLHRKTRFLSTLLYYLKAGFGKDPIIHAYSLLWYSHQIIGYWRFRLFYPKSGLDL